MDLCEGPWPTELHEAEKGTFSEGRAAEQIQTLTSFRIKFDAA